MNYLYSFFSEKGKADEKEERPIRTATCCSQAGPSSLSIQRWRLGLGFGGQDAFGCDLCGSCKVSDNLLDCPCGTAQYCSVSCQLGHWPVHGEGCHLMRIKQAEGDCSDGESDAANEHGESREDAWTMLGLDNVEAVTRECTYCGARSLYLPQCRCRYAFYCGVACQAADWDAHSAVCQALPQRERLEALLGGIPLDEIDKLAASVDTLHAQEEVEMINVHIERDDGAHEQLTHHSTFNRRIENPLDVVAVAADKETSAAGSLLPDGSETPSSAKMALDLVDLLGAEYDPVADNATRDSILFLVPTEEAQSCCAASGVGAAAPFRSLIGGALPANGGVGNYNGALAATLAATTTNSDYIGESIFSFNPDAGAYQHADPLEITEFTVSSMTARSRHMNTGSSISATPASAFVAASGGVSAWRSSRSLNNARFSRSLTSANNSSAGAHQYFYPIQTRTFNNGSVSRRNEVSSGRAMRSASAHSLAQLLPSSSTHRQPLHGPAMDVVPSLPAALIPTAPVVAEDVNETSSTSRFSAAAAPPPRERRKRGGRMFNALPDGTVLGSDEASEFATSTSNSSAAVAGVDDSAVGYDGNESGSSGVELSSRDTATTAALAAAMRDESELEEDVDVDADSSTEKET